MIEEMFIKYNNIFYWLLSCLVLSFACLMLFSSCINNTLILIFVVMFKLLLFSTICAWFDRFIVAVFLVRYKLLWTNEQLIWVFGKILNIKLFYCLCDYIDWFYWNKFQYYMILMLMVRIINICIKIVTRISYQL